MKIQIRHLAAAGKLSLAALCAAVQAATLAADGQWAGFAVDPNLPPYSSNWIDADHAPMSFSFTVSEGFQGMLTVVDSVYSGDRFTVTDNGQVLRITGGAVDGYDAFNPVSWRPRRGRAPPRLAGRHRGYAWLLQAGGQAGAARHYLAEALDIAPDDPALQAARQALHSPWPRPVTGLRQAPLRLAPWSWGAALPSNAEVMGSALLLGGNRAWRPPTCWAACGAVVSLRHTCMKCPAVLTNFICQFNPMRSKADERDGGDRANKRGWPEPGAGR